MSIEGKVFESAGGQMISLQYRRGRVGDGPDAPGVLFWISGDGNAGCWLEKPEALRLAAMIVEICGAPRV